jgi:hypothetical protein
MRTFGWLCVLLGLVIAAAGTAATMKQNETIRDRYLEQLVKSHDIATIRARLAVLARGQIPRAPGELDETVTLLFGFGITGFGILVLAIRRPRKHNASSTQEGRYPCRSCAELILPAAKLCPHCRSDLTQATDNPFGRIADRTSQR